MYKDLNNYHTHPHTHMLTHMHTDTEERKKGETDFHFTVKSGDSYSSAI